MSFQSNSTCVFFLESSLQVGGQEFQLLQQMLELKKLGFSPVLFCKKKSKIKSFAKGYGLETIYLSFSNAIDLKSIGRLCLKILSLKPCVLIVHSGHDALIGGLAAKLISIIGRKIKVIRMRTYQPTNKLASFFEYNYLFDATFTPSQHLRARILQNKKIRPENIYVLPPGIDFDLLDQNQNLPDSMLQWLSNRPGPILCHGAMLRKEKGHEVILNALPSLLKIFPNIRYVIAGIGPELENLQKFVKNHHLVDHVLFAGLVQPISSLLKISTLAIMPSLSEPLGMFQIESQYLGVPSLASDVDGIPETLIHQETGLLVKPGDVEEWTRQITWALNNLDLMREWAQNGNIFVRKKFSKKINTQNLLKILNLNVQSHLN
jgi:glycosyltransferase involved in cell wall biosynthesis